MYLVIRLIWVAQTVFLTAFLGILFGLAVSAGVDWVHSRVRAPRGLIAALIVLGSAGAIVAFFAVSGPVLATQSQELQTKLPEAIDKIDAWDVVNAQVELSSANNSWFVRGYVNNAMDDDNITGMYVTDASSGLFTNVFALDPRTYGLVLGFRF